MNWLDMFCFTSVARTQSFSVTARELMISQQAVSRHIKALEDELGVPLFLRGAQSLRLSRAGERMLRYFSQRESLLEEYERTSASRQAPSLLHVACSPWLGCPPVFDLLLERFRRLRPDVTILLLDLDQAGLEIALENLQTYLSMV